LEGRYKNKPSYKKMIFYWGKLLEKEKLFSR